MKKSEKISIILMVLGLVSLFVAIEELACSIYDLKETKNPNVESYEVPVSIIGYNQTDDNEITLFESEEGKVYKAEGYYEDDNVYMITIDDYDEVIVVWEVSECSLG